MMQASVEASRSGQSRFLKACRGQTVDRTPVWFMRQAGRYLPEYRRLREDHTLIELARTPELAAEVTLQPLRRFALDAAIIFSDILLVLPPLGVDFEFAKGEGPVIHRPLHTARQIEDLRDFEPEEELHFVHQAIRLVRSELPAEVALIGFAGAPFTVASYIIEGGYSRNFQLTRRMLYEQPELFRLLMVRLREVTLRHLKAQIEAGAQAVQLFDSWVGCLGPEEYREHVLPHSAYIFQGLRSLNVSLIHFGTGTSSLLELMRDAGCDVVGVDWRIDIAEAWARLGNDVAIQGNLDPVALLAPPQVLVRKAQHILLRVAGRPGHVFNLGHGILPETPVSRVETLVSCVQEWSLTRQET